MSRRIRLVLIITFCLVLPACSAMQKRPPPPLPPDLRDDLYNVAAADAEPLLSLIAQAQAARPGIISCSEGII